MQPGDIVQLGLWLGSTTSRTNSEQVLATRIEAAIEVQGGCAGFEVGAWQGPAAMQGRCPLKEKKRKAKC